MKLFELLEILDYKTYIRLINDNKRDIAYQGRVMGVPESLEHREMKYIKNYFGTLIITIED